MNVNSTNDHWSSVGLICCGQRFGGTDCWETQSASPCVSMLESLSEQSDFHRTQFRSTLPLSCFPCPERLTETKRYEVHEKTMFLQKYTYTWWNFKHLPTSVFSYHLLLDVAGNHWNILTLAGPLWTPTCSYLIHKILVTTDPKVLVSTSDLRSVSLTSTDALRWRKSLTNSGRQLTAAYKFSQSKDIITQAGSECHTVQCRLGFCITICWWSVIP